MSLLDDPSAIGDGVGETCSGATAATKGETPSRRTRRRDLLRRIAATWPELRLADARLIEEGGDHLILVLDGELAVRLPRDPGRDLTLEAAVLRVMRERTELKIPAYQLSPDGHLARYSFIEGTPLTPERFAALASGAKRTIAVQLGSFLSELHRLRADEVAPEACWPVRWTAAQFADHARRELLPALSRRLPSTMGKLERFYDVYERDRPEQQVVVHGDLVYEHLLLGPKPGGLAGIIDFGDVGLGDPAQDLAGLWAFGETSVRRVIASYLPSQSTKGLLERSIRAYLGQSLHRWGSDILEQQDWQRLLDRLTGRVSA